MKSYRVGITASLLGLGALVWAAASPAPVDARPQYKKYFAERYPGLAGKVDKVKCGVCHPPGAEKKKKARNNYGQALDKALNEKNVKNKDTIFQALMKIESEKSATEGKTFGDLIEAGTLPGKNE